MAEDSDESALIAELQPLAGVASGTHEFAVVVGAQTITVRYHLWRSGPSDLSLVAPYGEYVDQRPTTPGANPLRLTEDPVYEIRCVPASRGSS